MCKSARVESELKLTFVVELVGQGLCSLHHTEVMKSERLLIDTWE